MIERTVKFCLQVGLALLVGCAGQPRDVSDELREARERVEQEQEVQVTPEPDPIGSAEVTPGGRDGDTHDTPPAPRVQFLLFTNPQTCPPCVREDRDVLPVLEREGWMIGNTSDCLVHVIDERQFPDSFREWNVVSMPTFVLLKDGREATRMVGFQSAESLIAAYRGHAYTAENERVFATPGMQSRIRTDAWQRLPGLDVNLQSGSVRFASTQTVQLNKHVSIDCPAGCVLTKTGDHLAIAAPYPVVNLRFLLRKSAPLKGIRLDSANRTVTFELDGFFDQTFEY